MALRLALFALLLAVVVSVSAQRVPMPGEPTACNLSGTVTVTVADLSGAVIQNAFVLFSVPCGYVDFFVAADGFAPHAAKLVVAQDSSSASVRLDVYTMKEE